MTEFFGRGDRDAHGNIISGVPGWTQKKLRQNLEEEVQITEENLKAGRIPREARESYEERLEIDKQKLATIKEDTPNLRGEERDYWEREAKRWEEELRIRKTTITDMKSGEADALKELDKEESYSIKMKPEDAKKFRIMHQRDDNSVRVKDIERAWQIVRTALDGEAPNMDSLRKPGMTARHERLTKEVPGHTSEFPEEIKPESTFEHKGREVEVIKKKRGRPAGSKNKK